MSYYESSSLRRPLSLLDYIAIATIPLMFAALPLVVKESGAKVKAYEFDKARFDQMVKAVQELSMKKSGPQKIAWFGITGPAPLPAPLEYLSLLDGYEASVLMHKEKHAGDESKLFIRIELRSQNEQRMLRYLNIDGVELRQVVEAL